MMEVLGEQRWSRHKYPLQGFSKNSTLIPAPAKSPPNGVGYWASDRLPRDAQNHLDQGAKFYSISDSRGEHHSMMPHRGSEGGLASHWPGEENTDDAASSTAVSVSLRSTSPHSTIRDPRKQAGEGLDSPVSFQIPGSFVGEVQVLGNSPKNIHPPRSTAQPFTEYQRSVRTSSEDEDPEHPPAHAQRIDRHGPTKRTLRRTPRSRRIGSPIPPAEIEEAAPAANLTENGQDMAVSGTTPWKKQAYPLHTAPASGEIQDRAPTASREQQSPADQKAPGQVEVHDHHSSIKHSQDGRLDQGQSLWENHPMQALSPPSSPSDPINANKQSQSQQSNSKPRKGRKAGTYPLQTPASHTNLQASLTPPSSPDSELEQISEKSASQFPGNVQNHMKKKVLRRQAYPLQSPASVANLQASPMPALSTNNVPQNKAEPAPIKSKPLRRSVYPLQSPASVANLKPPSKEREPQVVDKTAPVQPATLRNQGYPLQSSVSVTPLHPSTVRSQGAKTVAPNTEKPASAPKKENLTYLQPPAILLPGGPTQFQKIDGSSATQPQSNEEARKLELARKVITHWRRQAYPTQAPGNTLHIPRVPTPRPPEGGEEKDTEPRIVHLPHNIRAVKDAKKDTYHGRTIVVCLDGTGDKFDNDNSNIVHLVSALKKDDAQQVTYYQAGIGTYGDGGLSGGVSAAMDMAVGSSLGLHVRDAYHFLMHSYKEGDKICIFSFSRGAYTARCLAGMIHKVGLLPPRNIQQIPFAYEFYANDTPEGWKQSNDFKKTFSIDVCVYFLGCFDSVASVGFIPRQLPLSSTPTNKSRYFRHAMALDERRAKFKVCRHQKKSWDEIEKAKSHETIVSYSATSKLLSYLPMYKSHDDHPPASSRETAEEDTRQNHPNLTDDEYGRLKFHGAPFETDVLEVWFAGCHADIGGGAVPNDERHKLAQIPLRWMIRQAFECNTGIIFNTAVLAEFGLDVHTLWPKYEKLTAPSHGPPPSFLEKYEKVLPPKANRRSKLVPIDKKEKGEHFYHLKSQTDEDWIPEQIEDFYDAMSPMNDQLEQAPTWWILEFWPVQYKVPKGSGEVAIRTGMNLGRYRGVEDVAPNLHWTVRHRSQHLGYQVRARTAPHTTWQTVV